MDIEQEIVTFNEFMAVRNFTDDTKYNYSSMLRKFHREFSGNIKRATIDELVSYIQTMKSRASMAQMYSALKFYYNFVLKQKRKFPFIPFPKKEKRLPNIPTHEQVLKVIDLTGNTKHRLIISILYGTGIRRSELIGIMWEDIKRTNKKENPLSIHIRGKGMKDRVVPLSEKLYKQLKQYCKQYNLKCNTNKQHYILGGVLPYSDKSVENVVKNAGERIGIHLTPHMLRHACFTYLRDCGVDIATIQELAGHESSATTIQYAKHNPVKVIMPV